MKIFNSLQIGLILFILIYLCVKLNSCGGFKKKKIKYWTLRKFGLENWCDENHAIFTNDFVNLNLSPQKIERRVKLWSLVWLTSLTACVNFISGSFNRNQNIECFVEWW